MSMKNSLRVESELTSKSDQATSANDPSVKSDALSSHKKSDSAVVYLSAKFFKDVTCTTLAAQETYAMNVCLPAGTNRHLFNSYTTTPSGYNIVTQYYSDATCTTAVGNPRVSTATTACGSNNDQNGYAVIVGAPPTTFSADGTLLK